MISRYNKVAPALFLILLASTVASCAYIGAFGKLETVLSEEEDPEIVAATLPTLLTLSQAVVEAEPKNIANLVKAASLYITYGNAFVQTPASFLPDTRIHEKSFAISRASALYKRAFSLLSKAMELRSPGIMQASLEQKPNFSAFSKADVALLYWTTASIFSAIGTNPLDFDMNLYIGAGLHFIQKAVDLDPGFNSGALCELQMLIYSSLPDFLGGDKEKAEKSYQNALAYSKGLSASLYVNYAITFALPAQDAITYKNYLEKALDPELVQGKNKLANILAQRRAKHLLDTIADYFDNTNSD